MSQNFVASSEYMNFTKIKKKPYQIPMTSNIVYGG